MENLTPQLSHLFPHLEAGEVTLLGVGGIMLLGVGEVTLLPTKAIRLRQKSLTILLGQATSGRETTRKTLSKSIAGKAARS